MTVAAAAAGMMLAVATKTTECGGDLVKYLSQLMRLWYFSSSINYKAQCQKHSFILKKLALVGWLC